MLDMVDYKALDYAGKKRLGRNQEIDLLERTAEAGESLLTIRECAQRIAQLKLRNSDYDQRMVAWRHEKLKDVLNFGRRYGFSGPEQNAQAGRYYASLFHATEGRQMLDKWDAEDAAMKETANA